MSNEIDLVIVVIISNQVPRSTGHGPWAAIPCALGSRSSVLTFYKNKLSPALLPPRAALLLLLPPLLRLLPDGLDVVALVPQLALEEGSMLSCRAHPYRAEVSSPSCSSPSIVYIQLCARLVSPAIPQTHELYREHATSDVHFTKGNQHNQVSPVFVETQQSPSTPEWPSKCTCRGARRGTGVGRRGALALL